VIGDVSAERRRTLPGGHVAAVAIRVRRCEVVIVSNVAIRASNDFACGLKLVRSRQSPPRGAVIKDGRGPGDGVVTRRAVGRCKGRARGRVGRVVGRLPGRQVASGISAIRRRNLQVVVVVDMAGGASGHLTSVGHQRVRICQREAKGIVIELTVRPFRDGMARRAGRRCGGKAGRDMIRHVSPKAWRAIPCREVAADAIR